MKINVFDPTKIISASNNIRGSGIQAQYYSTDGGISWGTTTLGSLFRDSVDGDDEHHSDPTVDWTSDSRAWSATLGIRGHNVIRLKGRSYVSTDFGATWQQDATWSGEQTQVDKEMMWVDRSATKVDGSPNPYFDNIYLVWSNGSPAFMNRRVASSGRWGVPIQVSGAEPVGRAVGSDVKTNADGEVFGFWPATGSRKIFAVKSTDGGESYGAPVPVATTYGAYSIGIPCMSLRTALIYVSGGAYKTARKNLVYGVWTDLSGEERCTQPSNAPGEKVNFSCKTRIWFTRSTDGGASWAAPVKLNDVSSRNDQFHPWLAVDESTGSLGLTYYDTVANQYGDYNGLSGHAGIFFPTWTDRRAGLYEEIWSARILDVDALSSRPVTGTPVRR